MLRTHEISEIEPGVFHTILEPCTVAVLPHVLAPEPSYVWLVEHWPQVELGWAELPVPLSVGASAAEPLRVRGVQYDLQMPAADFLTRVAPRLPRGHGGLILLQLDRPVPDTLRYRDVVAAPRRYAILRQNGWLLSFGLPHGGEYAEVTTAARGTLERILADPVIAAGKAAGDLP